MHLCSAEARVLSYLLRHLHGLLGTNNIMLAVLDPLFGGGRATTVGSFARVRRGNTEFLFVAENKASGRYPEGTRVGLVFSEIWADTIVSDRQDKSISRASVLFWMSAVRRWRASCKTLEEQTVQRSQERCQRVQDFRAAPHCPSPQVLEGLVHVLLQNLLHSLDELHLLPQLLLHRVGDKLVSSPSISQRQAFLTDLQGNGGVSQRLLGVLLGLTIHHWCKSVVLHAQGICSHYTAAAFLCFHI